MKESKSIRKLEKRDGDTLLSLFSQGFVGVLAGGKYTGKTISRHTSLRAEGVAICSAANNKITTGVNPEGISTCQNVSPCNDQTRLHLPKKVAFTLAEVLITLGIIGVVAAMTIPNLITGHQKRVTVTKLQKAISVINQAYRLSYNDVGEPEDAFALGADEYFKIYWEPYIKVSTLCTTYKMCGYTSNLPYTLPSRGVDDTYLISENARTTFLTPDGFVYNIMTAGGSGDGVSLIEHKYIRVDINGGSGPNRLGRDVFWLERFDGGGGIRPRGYDKPLTEINANCSYVGLGTYCAAKILRAGWQIDKSYPWK